MRNLFVSLRAMLFFTIALGLVYPFVTMGVGYTFFNHQATGSMYNENGRIIGSELIGQHMPSNLFQSRPSASDYNAQASGGSNYAINNPEQEKLVKERIEQLQQRYGKNKPVPEDLVFASGSGLDPDITADAAYYQADYIAKVNNIAPNKIYSLIKSNTRYRLFNTDTVNVLELNMDLMRLIHK
jgi:K+-transporting ATPase ATPase C chain